MCADEAPSSVMLRPHRPPLCCAVDALQNEERSKFKLVLNCIMIITSVIPPELPMELSMAVNASLLALSRKRVSEGERGCDSYYTHTTTGSVSIKYAASKPQVNIVHMGRPPLPVWCTNQFCQ